MSRLRYIARGAVISLGLGLGLAAVAVLAIRAAVRSAGRGRIHGLKEVPTRPVAIVFGAAVGSPMLYDRVATGAALYHTGKVRRLLLTGDNRHRSYNEPQAMRRLALAAGVPAEALVLDYAGRRTYDSCARAHDIFGLREAILVTQRFHLDRALYLCRKLGITEAVGVPADRRRYEGARSLAGRELLASVKAWLDVHLIAPYVVGGPPEAIDWSQAPAGYPSDARAADAAPPDREPPATPDP